MVFEILSFKENDSRKLYFMTDLEEALVIPFHWDYSGKIDEVCEIFKGESSCKYCDQPTKSMKFRERFGFYVYDMDLEKIGIICTLDSGNALLPVLCDLADEAGSLKGTSFVIDRTGYAKDSVFFGVPVDDVPEWVDGAQDATEENMKSNIFRFWDWLKVSKK